MASVVPVDDLGMLVTPGRGRRAASEGEAGGGLEVRGRAGWQEASDVVHGGAGGAGLPIGSDMLPGPPTRFASRSFHTPTSAASTAFHGSGATAQSARGRSVSSDSALRGRADARTTSSPALLGRVLSFGSSALSRRRRRSSTEPFAWDELPEAVQFAIVEMLDVPTLVAISAVSRTARRFALDDIVWRPRYCRKFLQPWSAVKAEHDFASLYKRRLKEPQPGDQVQVLWEGSFNLVSSNGVTAYEGRAWWEARIVERDGDAYNIHYPQWDSAIWDEWVTRDRIRWPPEADPAGTALHKGDTVEVKCLSTSGRSPWLESTITRVEDERYHVGSVIISGERAVPRSNVRLVRRARAAHSLTLQKCSIM